LLRLTQIRRNMNEIKLKLNGKDYNFSFGLGFLGELLDETGVELADLMGLLNKNPFKFIPLMMFRSCEYYNRRKDIQIDFNKYDFADIIDQDGGINTASVATFLDTFTKSLTKDVPKEDTSPKTPPKS
jgi:hypothetical protein